MVTAHAHCGGPKEPKRHQTLRQVASGDEGRHWCRSEGNLCLYVMGAHAFGKPYRQVGHVSRAIMHKRGGPKDRLLEFAQGVDANLVVGTRP